MLEDYFFRIERSYFYADLSALQLGAGERGVEIGVGVGETVGFETGVCFGVGVETRSRRTSCAAPVVPKFNPPRINAKLRIRTIFG